MANLKGKEKVREFKLGQTKSNKIQKIIMTSLNSRQNKLKNKQTRKSKVFIKSNHNTNFQQKGYWKHQSQPKNKPMFHNNSRWSDQYRDHTRLTQFPKFISQNVNYSGRGQHPRFNKLTKRTNFQNIKKFQKKN